MLQIINFDLKLKVIIIKKSKLIKRERKRGNLFIY